VLPKYVVFLLLFSLTLKEGDFFNLPEKVGGEDHFIIPEENLV
jgi:hypothetical protein